MSQEIKVPDMSLEAVVENPFAEIVMLTQLLAMEPKRTDALLRRALVLLNMGQLVEAEADLNVAMELPDKWEKEIDKVRCKVAVCYYERGRMRHVSGDDKGAMEDMRHAMEMAPEIVKEITGRFNK